MKITETIFEKLKRLRSDFNCYYRDSSYNFKVFGVALNDVIDFNTLGLDKKMAMNKKSASWWLENPEAKVVELELVEKKS
jgi:hypothetical protein